MYPVPHSTLHELFNRKYVFVWLWATFRQTQTAS